MATFALTGDVDLMKQLTELEQSMPDICEKMISAGEEVAYKTIKTNTPYDSLKRSLKLKKPKLSKNGVWYGRIDFNGYKPNTKTKRHPKGTPYSLIAAVTEYGSPKLTAKPFVKPSMNSAEESIKKAMQDVYENREAEVTK